MKKKKIAIIGHFGGNENFLDGQTIKTKMLYAELSKYNNFKLRKVDTYYKRKNPIKLLFNIFVALLTSKHVFILVAENGMKFFFPILYFFSKVFGKKVYHSVIGASLDRRVIKYKKFKKYLNSFAVNWVETIGLKERLQLLGVENAELLYNFKDLTPVETASPYAEKPYKLCIFSRVMKEKGIEDAVEAVKFVNNKVNDIVYTLDIFGQVDEAQVQWFENLQQSFPEYVSYKGLVAFDKSVEVLKDYFALLFPTKYYTEGVPGTIIDAYAAALPVIASKWENYDNIIDEKTGVSYDFDNLESLKELLLEIHEDPNVINSKRDECLKRYQLFIPEAIMSVITTKIDKA